MKPVYTLHKLPEGFIITSNQQPVNGLYLDTYINKVKNTNGAEYGINEITKQVIAQQDQIDFSNLTEEELREIGWFDVEKLAKKMLPNDSDWQRRFDIIRGFQKAQELLSDRRFTLEDVNNAYDAGMKFIGEDKGSPIEFIQSLSQKSWNIEIETECSVCGLTNTHKMSCKTPSLRTQQPRFNNGKIKIIKIL